MTVQFLVGIVTRLGIICVFRYLLISYFIKENIYIIFSLIMAFIFGQISFNLNNKKKAFKKYIKYLITNSKLTDSNA